MWIFKGAILFILSLQCLSNPVKISNPQGVTPETLTPEQMSHIFGNQQINGYELHPLYIPDPESSRYASGQDSISDRYANYYNQNPYANNNQRDSYDFYFPQGEDKIRQYDVKEKLLQELRPPVVANEPNYYIIKPRKGGKKYVPNSKHVNYKKSYTKTTVQPKSVSDPELRFTDKSPYYVNPLNGNRYRTVGAGYVIGENNQQQSIRQKPEQFSVKATVKPLRLADLNTGEVIADKAKAKGSRVEFQMHGFNGPNSYKFGYDTGKGKNRQFRIEHRDKDGNVEGQYGYYDKKGKWIIVKYTAKVGDGFRVQKSM